MKDYTVKDLPAGRRATFLYALRKADRCNFRQRAPSAAACAI
jgi:hypothetical protein